MYSNQEKEIKFEGYLSQLSPKKLPFLTSYKFSVGGSKKMATFLLSKLDSLVNLRKLDLSGYSWASNEHGPLLVSKISVLSKLEFLDCSDCDLQELPSSLCELKNLKVLNCSRNQLKSLPSDLCLLQALEEFRFSGCDLRELASSLFELKNLRILDCSWNKLKSLPSDLCLLQNLEEFNCSNCDLKKLDSSLCHLKNLRILDCSGNEKLKSLPSDLRFLQALEKFVCSRCDLKKLSSSICELKNLKILNCGENELKSLPYDLGSLQNLEEFYCNHNQLDSLPFSLGDLSNLKRFYCCNNDLFSFPVSLCHLSPTLEIIYFNNPLLSEIPTDWENLLIYLKEKEVQTDFFGIATLESHTTPKQSQMYSNQKVWEKDIEQYPQTCYTFITKCGYTGEIKRNLLLAYCGYVSLPEGHLDFHKTYAALARHINVHGQLTFGEKGVFGFDCSQSEDLVPLAKDPFSDRKHYWTFEEVKKEVEYMAFQFKLREA